MSTYNEQIHFLISVIPEDILDDALNWVSANCHPHNVFTQDQLEEWALDNGFKKVDNTND